MSLPSSPLPRRPRPRRPSSQPQQKNRRELLVLYRCSLMIGITFFTVNNYLNLIALSSTLLVYSTNYINIPNGDHYGGSPFVGTRNTNSKIVESSKNTNTTHKTKTKNTATATVTYDAVASSSALSDVITAKIVNIADDFDLPSASESQLASRESGSSSSSSSSQSNININNNTRLDCGKKKCFISSLAYPNDIGYLVGTYKDYEKQLIKFIKAWKFTKWMDEQFSDNSNSNSKQKRKQKRKRKRSYHFYINERPTIVELSTTTLTKLNNLAYNTNQKKRYSPELLYTKSKVAIQKVRKVKIKDMLFFGCSPNNYGRYLDEKNTFFLQNKNKTNFSNNLRDSIQIMKRMLKLQPKMFKDFQVLFDTHGYVYFFDVDGQYYHLKIRRKIGLEKKRKDCLQ